MADEERLVVPPADPASDPDAGSGSGYGSTHGSNAHTIGRADAATVGRANHRPDAPNGGGEYMQTFAAGEDPARLAAAAREMGLARRRKPMAQVRTRPTSLRDVIRLRSGSNFLKCRRLLSSMRQVRSRDYEGEATEFFRETFGRIVFEEEEPESSFGETLAGVAGNVLVSFPARTTTTTDDVSLPLRFLLYATRVAPTDRAPTASVRFSPSPDFRSTVPRSARSGTISQVSG